MQVGLTAWRRIARFEFTGQESGFCPLWSMEERNSAASIGPPIQKLSKLLNFVNFTIKGKTMTFTLEPNEAAFIVRVIGQLPTESRSFPLYEKLEAQFKKQDSEQEAMQVGGTD